MLTLQRKFGESIVLSVNGEVIATVIVVGGHHGRIRLGFNAPPNVSIDRKEIWDAKVAKGEQAVSVQEYKARKAAEGQAT